MASTEIFEYRGVDNLVYAKVIEDTKENYITGEVKWLSPVAEIERTTENSSEAHYYDNKPLIVISSTGSDNLVLTVAPLDLPTYAEITGQTFDAETGSLIEGERNNDYFVIGYRTKGTDGKYRYVWRYKGQFGIPDESNATENDGTDTTNTQLAWTGVSTVHEFAKYGKSAKALICDERFNSVIFDEFFSEVKTPDNLQGSGVGRTATPYIYPDTTTFRGLLKVSIVCSTAVQTDIFYTTDGSEPNTVEGGSTHKYESPFNTANSVTVKAVAVAQGKEKSLTATKVYTKLS